MPGCKGEECNKMQILRMLISDNPQRPTSYQLPCGWLKTKMLLHNIVIILVTAADTGTQTGRLLQSYIMTAADNYTQIDKLLPSYGMTAADTGTDNLLPSQVSSNGRRAVYVDTEREASKEVISSAMAADVTVTENDKLVANCSEMVNGNRCGYSWPHWKDYNWQPIRGADEKKKKVKTSEFKEDSAKTRTKQSLQAIFIIPTLVGSSGTNLNLHNSSKHPRVKQLLRIKPIPKHHLNKSNLSKLLELQLIAKDIIGQQKTQQKLAVDGEDGRGVNADTFSNNGQKAITQRTRIRFDKSVRRNKQHSALVLREVDKTQENAFKEQNEAAPMMNMKKLPKRRNRQDNIPVCYSLLTTDKRQRKIICENT